MEPRCPFFQTEDAETIIDYKPPSMNLNKHRTDVVLVTGGAGFLGQHVVQQLQERAEYIKEIRVLDLKPYKKILDHAEPKPVTSIVGSITDWDLVQRVCDGVNSVIHIAGLVSYGTFPDTDGMKLTNVQGTKNIIDGCVRSGVERLVYCSTVDVVVGYQNITNGREATTQVPEKFLFPGYPDTKNQAECLVLKSDGRKCHQGRILRCISLRANVMYGEGDPFYVTGGLRTAMNNHNCLIQVGPGTSKFQQAYVGNAAWAFVCADIALQVDPGLGGEVFYIPDDTPVQNPFKFMKPYLESRNCRLSNYRVPYVLVYPVLRLLEVFVYLVSPLIKICLPTASCSVRYINMDLFFDGRKGRQLLQYNPIYTPQESRKRSLEYYKNVKL